MKVYLNHFIKHRCLPANQEQAIDQFMVDWFASDQVNNMSSNLEDERVNVDNPHFPDIARGQKHWHEARAHARTSIFQGARLSRLAAILWLLNIQAKHKASNYYVVRHFSILPWPLAT
jgi:hypothetical protein